MLQFVLQGCSPTEGARQLCCKGARQLWRWQVSRTVRSWRILLTVASPGLHIGESAAEHSTSAKDEG
jgi:hypothetical protein